MGRTIVCFFFLPALLFGQNGTFQECWSHVQKAFTIGAASEAHAMLQYMEAEFSDEKLFTDNAFQRRFIPARALLQIEFGEFHAASRNLEYFIQKLGPPARQRAWAEWTLARLAHQTGDFEKAEEGYRQFITDYRELSEFWLAQWYLAELLNQKEALHHSLETYRGIAEDASAPQHLRQQSALRAATLAIQNNDPGLAFIILQSIQWQQAEFPEAAMLANTAFRLQEMFRTSGQFHHALECSRWIAPKDLLIQKQSSYLSQLREQWQRANSGWARHAPLWQNHLERRLRMAEAWLDSFNQSDDYTGKWILSKTSAFLAIEQPWLALGKLDVLNNLKGLDGELHREAKLLRIHVLQEIQNWILADQYAESFLKKWPDDPRIPDILFALAKGWHGRGELTEALFRLEELRRAYPDHPSTALWKFHHARWLCENGQIDSALQKFSLLYQNHSSHPIMAVAMYLAAEYALLYQKEDYFQTFTNHLGNAIQSDHPLQPYLRWLKIRHAHLQDRQQDFIHHTRAFTLDYFGHPLWADAWNLHGDFHYERGEWGKAIDSWERITADHGEAWQHAIFRQLEVYFHKEQWLTCIVLLKNYRSQYPRTHTIPPQAMATLHWLGQLMDRPAITNDAVGEFLQFLNSWKNSPHIEDFLPTLQTLKRSTENAGSIFNWEPWFQSQIQKAISEEKLTWWSRLMLLESEVNPLNNHRREGYFLRIAQRTDIEHLDARGLYHVGTMLMRSHFPEANRYLHHLSKRFPNCQWIPNAKFELAKWYHNENTDKSLQFWDQLVTQFPMHPLSFEAQWELAKFEFKNKDSNSAISRLESIIRERQTPAELKARSWKLLGDVALKAQKHDEAIHCYQRVLTLFPGFTETAEAAIANLLEVYTLENNYAAIKSLIDWIEAANFTFADQWGEKIRQTLSMQNLQHQNEPI